MSQRRTITVGGRKLTRAAMQFPVVENGVRRDKIGLLREGWLVAIGDHEFMVFRAPRLRRVGGRRAKRKLCWFLRHTSGWRPVKGYWQTRAQALAVASGYLEKCSPEMLQHGVMQFALLGTNVYLATNDRTGTMVLDTYQQSV